MNVYIEVIDAVPKKRNNVFVIKGKIKINTFEELLYIPLDWWSLSDYKKQWEEGLRRLITYDTSCMVVSIHNPHIRPFINWWLLYKVEEKVYIRNQLIIGDIYAEQMGDSPFTVETCYNFIPQRQDAYDEYGNEISEWVVNWNNFIE